MNNPQYHDDDKDNNAILSSAPLGDGKIRQGVLPKLMLRPH